MLHDLQKVNLNCFYILYFPKALSLMKNKRICGSVGGTQTSLILNSAASYYEVPSPQLACTYTASDLTIVILYLTFI